MRVPSIHITKPALHKVLKKLQKEMDISWGVPLDNLVEEIMLASKVYSLNHRNLLVDTQKLAKKTSKLTMSKQSDALMFAKYLQLIRKQHRHIGISIIKEGSKEWAVLKEVTSLAVGFANDFELSREKAFEEYISIALTKMGKFSLNRFNLLNPQIYEAYEAKISLGSMDSPLAESAHRIYRQKIIDRVGDAIDYTKQPEKYIKFCEVAEVCKSRGIRVEDYINAQFEGLDWAGGIPEPHSLLGTKADERLQKYLFKHNLRLDEADKPKIDWSKIKG